MKPLKWRFAMVALFAASLALLPLVSLAQQQPIKAEVDRLKEQVLNVE